MPVLGSAIVPTDPGRVNVQSFGAKGDAVSRTDGATTNASTTFTAAGANFTAADVGKFINIYSAGTATNVDLTTTITAVVSATQVTLAAPAQATLTNRVFTYGTDDTAAITAAIATLRDNGTLYFPVGRYLDTLARSFDLSNNVTILGETNQQWVRDSLTPAPASDWLYAGTAATFISARQTVAFEVRGMALRYINKSFAGILCDLSGGTTRHTFTPVFDTVYFGDVRGVVTAAACIDLRGMVVASFNNCTFTGATAHIQTATGSDIFSNAVTFRDCTFDYGAVASSALQSTAACVLSAWLFDGCTFERTPLRFLNALGVTFQGCGFWDQAASVAFIRQASGTINALSFVGCYWEPGTGGAAFALATVVGMTVTGNVFAANGTGAIWVAPTGTVTKLLFRGNSTIAPVTDNTGSVGGLTMDIT